MLTQRGGMEAGRGEWGSRGREHRYNHDWFTLFTAETNTTLQSNYTPIKKKKHSFLRKPVTWEINFYDDEANLFVMAKSPLIQYRTLYKLSEICLSSS